MRVLAGRIAGSRHLRVARSFTTQAPAHRQASTPWHAAREWRRPSIKASLSRRGLSPGSGWRGKWWGRIQNEEMGVKNTVVLTIVSLKYTVPVDYSA